MNSTTAAWENEPESKSLSKRELEEAWKRCKEEKKQKVKNMASLTWRIVKGLKKSLEAKKGRLGKGKKKWTNEEKVDQWMEREDRENNRERDDAR